MDAPSQGEVIEKEKYKHKNEPGGYIGVTDGHSYDRAKFKVDKNN